MLRTILKRLLGKPPPSHPPQALAIDPVNVPVPHNDPTPPRVQLRTMRHVLRRRGTDTLVLAGTTVTTTNRISMRIASGVQKPPYVRCIYRGRPLAVRADTIDCRWDTVSEPIQ